jgi:beta-phosphoglucomutase-like phosphatase (HAD superfamily)
MASKALIWDLDGVIADTAPFHFLAWQQVTRERLEKADKVVDSLEEVTVNTLESLLQ